MTRALQRTLTEVQRLRASDERASVIEFPRTLGEYYAEFLTLPGLYGFWPMSQVLRSTGNAADMSGSGKALTYNGNPTYNLYNSLVPYLDCDGTGDFLSRADETDLDILGTETIYAATTRGVTMGGWFNQDNIVGAQGLIGKWNPTGNLRSYRLFSNAGVITLGISSDGTAEAFYTGSTVTAGAWYFAIGTWTPSATGVVWVNGVKTSTASAVASMTNLTAPFRIGARGDAAEFLTGNAGPCFLTANNLPDARCQRLFNLGRVFFGV
jgi:concanavalin A-like lectin/glucanase superfamily protein